MIKRASLIMATALWLPQAAFAQVATDGNGAILRALDKVSGEVVEFDLTQGMTKQMGRIQVTLGECRYPTGNPSGNAFAYLSIRNAGQDATLFQGWMIASSPALNALDDPRYDVWVIRCTT